MVETKFTWNIFSKEKKKNCWEYDPLYILKLLMNIDS